MRAELPAPSTALILSFPKLRARPPPRTAWSASEGPPHRALPFHPSPSARSHVTPTRAHPPPNTYTHEHINTHAHAHTHVYTVHTRTPTRTHVYTQTHKCTYTYTVHAHARPHVYSAHTCTQCTHVHPHVHMCTHMNTHVHTHTPFQIGSSCQQGLARAHACAREALLWWDEFVPTNAHAPLDSQGSRGGAGEALCR